MRTIFFVCAILFSLVVTGSVGNAQPADGVKILPDGSTLTVFTDPWGWKHSIVVKGGQMTEMWKWNPQHQLAYIYQITGTGPHTWEFDWTTDPATVKFDGVATPPKKVTPKSKTLKWYSLEAIRPRHRLR